MSAPKNIADVLAELINRRGYAREESAGVDHATWTEIAGASIAKFTRVGELKRGVLEIIAANNIIVSELNFQKAKLLTDLNAKQPKHQLKDLRFKVGQVKKK